MGAHNPEAIGRFRRAPGVDFNTVSGSLTFLPGETTKTLGVRVIGDTNVEVDEVFVLKLTGSCNAPIDKAIGRGMILNADVPVVPDPPTLSISDVEQIEGDNGNIYFLVRSDYHSRLPRFRDSTEPGISSTDSTA